MTLLATVLVLASVIPTAFLSGIFGMAGGIILMGVLVTALPVAQAMVLHGVTQVVANGSRALFLLPYIKWRIIVLHLVGAVATLGVLARLSVVPNALVVLVILGAIPFVHRGVGRFVPLHIEQPGMPVIGGVFTTVFQVLSGVAGPLIDTLYVRSNFDKLTIVATKSATQSLSHMLKVVYFSLIVGEILAADSDVGAALPLWLFGAAAGLAVIGTAAGNKVLRLMPEHQFRVWTQRIVMAIGLVFLVRAGFVAVAA